MLPYEVLGTGAGQLSDLAALGIHTSATTNGEVYLGSINCLVEIKSKMSEIRNVTRMTVITGSLDFHFLTAILLMYIKGIVD